MKILLFAAVLAGARAGASSTGILVHGCHLQATGMKSWEMIDNQKKRSWEGSIAWWLQTNTSANQKTVIQT